MTTEGIGGKQGSGSLARIRCIKPGFFKNEQLAEFSFAHRMLFAGLWTQADREGRLEDRPRRIKAELFPYDDGVDVGAMLGDLAAGDDPLIVRYVVSGKGYIWVRKFLEHQRPHHTEPDSTYPPPEQGFTETPEKVGAAPEMHGSAPLGKEGKGREGKGREVALARQPSPADLKALWNDETTSPIPRCEELSEKRRRAAHNRLRERPLDAWRAVIRRIQASSFCRGQNDRAWVATFDWLLQPDVATKVIEGKYDDRIRVVPTGRPTAAQTTIATANRG